MGRLLGFGNLEVDREIFYGVIKAFVRRGQLG